MLKFYLVTDTHFYPAGTLGFSENMDQKCMNESGPIIDSAFDILAAKQDSDIILIAGDLSNNGERPGHEQFIQKLHKLKDSGKRIYVVTATHDYGLREVFEDGKSENDNPQNLVSREELWDMYYEFGPKDAIAENVRYLSYVVQLAPGYRLLCLNDDGNGRSFCGYNSEQLQWILEQIKKAEDDAKNLIAGAEERAHAIIAEAEAEKNNTLDKLSSELKLTMSEAVKEATSQAKILNEQSLVQSNAEAQQLISELSSRKQAAVSLVLDEILKK